MSDLDILVKEIARVVLAHGYLHLGNSTLSEFIGRELDVSDEELQRVEQYLNALLEGENK